MALNTNINPHNSKRGSTPVCPHGECGGNTRMRDEHNWCPRNFLSYPQHGHGMPARITSSPTLPTTLSRLHPRVLLLVLLLLFSKRLAKLPFWETCKDCVRKAFSSWLIQYSMYPIRFSIFGMYSMDPRCSAQERRKMAAVLMS